MADDPSKETTTWPLLAGIIAAVSVFAIAQGLTYPLLSFILAEQGISPTMIGLSAAMTPLGLIVSSLFMPWLAKRFGPTTLVINSVWLATLTLALIALIPDVVLWFPLRFLLGRGAFLACGLCLWAIRNRLPNLAEGEARRRPSEGLSKGSDTSVCRNISCRIRAGCRSSHLMACPML